MSYRANTVEVFEMLFRFIWSLPPRTRDSVLRQVRTLLSTPANLPGETTAEKAFRKEINARDTRLVGKLDQAQDGKKVSGCVVS